MYSKLFSILCYDTVSKTVSCLTDVDNVVDHEDDENDAIDINIIDGDDLDG